MRKDKNRKQESERRHKDRNEKPTNPYCLILQHDSGRKIVGNFAPSRPLAPDQRKQYISFNYDGQKCTPAFIYENQVRSLQKCRQGYENRLRASREPLNTNYKPIQPKERKNAFCCVCRKNYDNYSEHVQDRRHIECCENSEFTEGLKKIERYYVDKKNRRIQKESKGARKDEKAKEKERRDKEKERRDQQRENASKK